MVEKTPVLRAYVTWLQTAGRFDDMDLECAFTAGFKAGTDAATTCSTIREAFANEQKCIVDENGNTGWIIP
ncbi:MAG: hypothetical protein K0M55_19960 [Rhizobium sp.]|nr:hypothetical protein [Rhizobium sp.]MBW8318492.1 hypothetical protein [Rhizobium sp.]MBW8445211.1 hypothetical protein [Arenimonas sp.]